jgi:hypothetical protein
LLFCVHLAIVDIVWFLNELHRVCSFKDAKVAHIIVEILKRLYIYQRLQGWGGVFLKSDLKELFIVLLNKNLVVEKYLRPIKN